MRLQYDNTLLVPEGLYDELDVDDADPLAAEKITAVKVFRSIMASSDIRIIVQMRDDTLHNALNKLKEKLSFEERFPPFCEYLSEKKTHVCTWNNEHLSPVSKSKACL